jgi:hypothetical protein
MTYLSLVSDEYFTPQEEMALSGAQLGDLRDPRLFWLQFEHTQEYPRSATPIEVMLDPKLERIVWRPVQQVIRKLKKIMVPGGGLEPPTRGFSVPCSTT